jgi:hypothetical protein
MLAMKTTLHPTTTDVLTDVQYHPVISLLIPFEPKMVLKSRLLAALGSVTARVEQQLLEKYQGDIAMLMIAKLHSLMAGLNYNTHKKASPFIYRR